MKGQIHSMRPTGIFGVIFVVLLLTGLFFLAKGIFTILLWLSPFFIIGAIVLNYKTVIGYLRFVLSVFQRNPLAGIIVTVLSIIGFPVLSGVLFAKAFFDRKIRRLQRVHEANEAAEYVPYEEVIKPESSDSLDLPPLEKEQAEKKDNRYDNLF